MFVIRREQLAAFMPRVDAIFIDRTMAFLREECSDVLEEIPEPQLRSMVTSGLIRARKLGLEAEATIQAYITMMLQFGPSFDSHPEVARRMQDATIPADERLISLILECSDRIWDELEILSDPHGGTDATGSTNGAG